MKKTHSKSRETLRQLFEQMGSGVAMYEAVEDGKDFVFRDINHAAERIEHVTKEAILGKRVTEVFPGIEDFGILSVFQRVWKTGKLEYFPEAVYHDKRNPEPSWRENWVYKLSSGEIVAVYNDITARKRTEERLRESERKYRSIFENAVEGIFQSTPDGRLMSVNPALASTFGYQSPEDMMAHVTDIGLQLYVDPEEKTKYAELRHKNGVVRGLEARFYRKDGTMLWGSLNVREEKDPTGRILYYEGTFEDITSRKLAEEELRKTTEKLRATLGGTINALSLAVEMRDPYTSGHQKRVSNLARSIAQEMGLPKDEVENIRIAGVIHDIGKISVPAEILSKPTKLTDIEMSLIKVHSQSGYDILKNSGLPHPVAETVLQHHERLDGSGYPQGLKGEEIVLEARIIAVADVVEAMASHRPYRPGRGIDTALEEIEKNRGILYDPEAVEACLSLFREKGFIFG